MLNILVTLIEKIIYKFIPRLPYFMRTPLYRKFLLLRKLRDYLILAKSKLTYDERLEHADRARSNEHLICGLQNYNNDVRFSELDLDTLDIFKFEPKNKVEGQIGIYFHGGGFFYCPIP